MRTFFQQLLIIQVKYKCVVFISLELEVLFFSILNFVLVSACVLVNVVCIFATIIYN